MSTQTTVRQVVRAHMRFLRIVKHKRRWNEISNAEQQRDLRRQFSAASMIAPISGTFRKEKVDDLENLTEFIDEYARFSPAIVHKHLDKFW